MTTREIHCCGCAKKVQARLTSGREIYPHRADLASLPFWRCDTCGNFVGCHHKTADRTRPLGIIPTAEIRNARQHIHRVLDPLWKSGRFSRRGLYAKITERFGWKYHTANIRSVDEAREIYKFVQQLGRGKS